MIDDTIRRIIKHERECIQRIGESEPDDYNAKILMEYHEGRAQYYELLLEQLETNVILTR